MVVELNTEVQKNLVTNNFVEPLTNTKIYGILAL